MFFWGQWSSHLPGSLDESRPRPVELHRLRDQRQRRGQRRLATTSLRPNGRRLADFFGSKRESNFPTKQYKAKGELWWFMIIYDYLRFKISFLWIWRCLSYSKLLEYDGISECQLTVVDLVVGWVEKSRVFRWMTPRIPQLLCFVNRLSVEKKN